MNIKWNEVTSYSKLLAAIVLLGFLPVLAFYIGMQYEITIASLTSASIAASEQIHGPSNQMPAQDTSDSDDSTSSAAFASAVGSMSLTKSMILNGSFAVPDTEAQGPVVFTNGKFSQPTEGDSSVSISIDSSVIGSINGSAGQSAAIVWGEEDGGTGYFVNLGVVKQIGGTLQLVGSMFVDDRAVVKSLSIQDGFIVMDYVRHEGSDAGCCASHHYVGRYYLVDGKLTLKDEQFLGIEDQ